MRTIQPRILITLEGGMISFVGSEGIANSAGIQVVIVDYDTDDAEEDELVEINGTEARFTVDGLQDIDPEVATDVSRAYDNWSL